MTRYVFLHQMNNKGFTLIEVLLYITLLSFLTSSLIATAFYIIDGSRRLEHEVHTAQEAHFIFKKIEQVLRTDIDANFRLHDGYIEVEDGNSWKRLSGGMYEVSSFLMSTDTSGTPPVHGIIEVTLGGTLFSTSLVLFNN